MAALRRHRHGCQVRAAPAARRGRAGRGVDVVLLVDPGWVAAVREFQQRCPLVWSQDTGGGWAAAPARVTPGRAADT